MTDSTRRKPDQIADDWSLLHAFKNHLSVVVGFCELLLGALPKDDPKRADILEMRKAGHAAIALLPEPS